MKKFNFKLDTVMDYKKQVLENRLIEHGAAAARANAQAEVVEGLRQQLTDYEAEYRRKKLEGLAIVEVLQYQDCLEALERELRRQEERLKQLRRVEEEKRSQVIESRKETATLEKLRDIKKQEYQKMVAKDEERFIDDLTAARRIASNA